MTPWRSAFERGLPYQAFLDAYADPSTDLSRWQRVYDRTHLMDQQKDLLAGFRRQMNVLCLAGAWCGDCVEQGPILQRIAEAAADMVDLRFLDRDDNPDMQEALRICGGKRIPAVVFLSEDFHECARFGDRTLAAYREMAVELVGAACPVGLVLKSDLHAAQVQDWLDQFERVQLMLRLSARLRAKHMD